MLDGAQQRERAALRAHDGDAIQEGMQTFLGLRFFFPWMVIIEGTQNNRRQRMRDDEKGASVSFRVTVTGTKPSGNPRWTPDRPGGRFPEFPCARGAQSAESSRGWGATAVPEDASTARTRHVTPACGVLIAAAGRARPRWARARPEPRRAAHGGGRRRDGKWARRIGLNRWRCRSGPRARGGRGRGRRGDAPCVAKQRSTRRALRRCVSRYESGATRNGGVVANHPSRQKEVLFEPHFGD